MRRLRLTFAPAAILILVVLPAVSAQLPFARGFNLGQWFQGASAREISNCVTLTDLENMKALGADHVRVPIDLRNMSGNGPGYVIDPILLMYLDRLVDWCEALGLYVILDNHTLLPLDADPARETRTIAVWRQMAAHFENRSELVLYEILNEPVGIPTWEWGRIQQKAIDAIRAIDSTHAIIVSPAEVGSYDYLHELPEYSDDNLVYTFHFYDPFLFTHQGTNWTDPSMETLHGIPYPYSASRMPRMPGSFSGTWLGQLWDWYAASATPASLEDRLSVPVQFSARRRTPIYCGEFSVWASAAAHADVVRWYSDVRSLLENDGIPWTLLDDKGPFGIYEQNSAQVFPDDLDLDLVQALGLNVPGPLTIPPDTAGLTIYDDLVSGVLFDGGHGGHGGILDLYDATNPAEGAYSLHWTGAPRYGAITWRFTNPRDLSHLKSADYRIRFLMRTDSPDLRFDIRFLDTDTGEQDHPWRMVKTIDSSLVPMDGQWHEVEFALSDMLDVGSFDDNAWYGSEGAFDWARIERFEIVAEHQALYGRNLWLDHVQVVAPPTPASSAASSSGNLLANGDFSSGMDFWETYIHEAGGVQAQFVIHASALNAYLLGTGTDPWNIQLIQRGIPLQQGTTYAVEFDGWADAERPINVMLTQDGGSFVSYFSETFGLTTEPTSYRLTFRMGAASDPTARFVVEMGTSDINLKLANFTLVAE